MLCIRRIKTISLFLLLAVNSMLLGQSDRPQPQAIIDYFTNSPFNLEETGQVQLLIGNEGTISADGVLLESSDGQVRVVVTPLDVLILSGVDSHPELPVAINTIGAALFNLNPTLNSLLLKTRLDDGDNFEGRFIDGQTITVPGHTDPIMGIENTEKTITETQLRLFDIEIENAVQSAGGLRSMGVTVDLNDASGNRMLVNDDAARVPVPVWDAAVWFGQITGVGGGADTSPDGGYTNFHRRFDIELFQFQDPRGEERFFLSSTRDVTLFNNDLKSVNGSRLSGLNTSTMLFIGLSILRNELSSVSGLSFSESDITVSGKFEGFSGLVNFFSLENRITDAVSADTFAPDFPQLNLDFEIESLIEESSSGLWLDNFDDVSLVACSDCSGVLSFDIPAGDSEVSGSFPEKWNDFIFQPEGSSMGYSGFEILRTGGNSYEIRDANGSKIHSGSLEVGSVFFGLEDLESQLRSSFQATSEVYSAIESGRFGIENIDNLLNGSDNVSSLFNSGNLDQRAAAFNDVGLFLRGSLNNFSFDRNLIPSLTHFDVPILNLDQSFFRTGTSGGSGNDLFGLVARPVSGLDKLSIQNGLINKEMLPGSSHYDDLFGVLSSRAEDRDHLQRVLEQSLALDRERQSLLQGSYGEDVNVSKAFSQSDIYPYLRVSNELAGVQMADALRAGSLTSDVSIGEKWLEQLKASDERLFQGIVEKVESFQKTHGSKSGNVTLIPRFSFDMDITPKARVSEGVLDLNQISYKVDLKLENVVLQLGLDDDCDGKAESSVALSKIEQDFLRDEWAKDSDGDGVIDSGFLLWLQPRMDRAEKRISLALYTGENNTYSRLNTVVSLMAAGEWYKTLLSEDELELPADLSDLVNSNNLTNQNLQSGIEYPDFEIASSSPQTLAVDMAAFRNLNLSVTPIDVRSSWNALELTIEESETLTPYASESASSGLSVENFRFISLSAFENNDNAIAYGTEYWLKSSLINTGSSNRSNMRVDFEITTDKDMAWFHVYRWDVSSLSRGSEERMVFNFRPLTTGMHTMRVQVDGQTVYSKRFNVLADNESILDREAYCGATFSHGQVVLANETETFTGGNVVSVGGVDSGGHLTFQASNRIVLSSGFHAKRGSRLNTAKVSCQTVQDSLD